jgi:hypothetical protein
MNRSRFRTKCATVSRSILCRTCVLKITIRKVCYCYSDWPCTSIQG